MSDCCNDFPISCAPKAPGGCNPCGPCKPPRPCPPPAVKPGTSMYIGARYVPIFADPVYWSNDWAFEPLTIVVKDGDCYTSKCYVPEGAPLPVRPENQNTYWVRTSDYNYQFEELRQAVVDLSKQVEKFAQDNKDFTAQMQAWNATMQEWSGKIEDWGQTMDQFNTRVEAVENGLAEEIARAKAAEAANAAAITAEADRAKEAETQIANRVTVTETDISAIKAEQTIQNNNITANAKNIQDNAAEIAKHAKRLTDLESNASDWDSVFPDTTIAQEVQKEENTRANAVTELKAKDNQLAADIEEVRDLANHKVDQSAFTAADNLNVKYKSSDKRLVSAPQLFESDLATREDLNNSRLLGSNINNTGLGLFGQVSIAKLALKSEVDMAQAAADKANANIGDWETDHPGQTISQCVTSLENEQAATDAKADANTAALENKADKSEIPDVSGLLPKTEAAETYQPLGDYVTTDIYNNGQAAQNYKTQIPEGGVRMQTAGVYWNLDTSIKMTVPLWVIPSNWNIQWTQQPDLTVPRLPTSGLIELFNPKTGAFIDKAYTAFRVRFDAINGCLEFTLFCDASDLPQAVLVTSIKTIKDTLTTRYPYLYMLWNA